MNDTPALDDLEQHVIRTLSAKADQVTVVDDTPPTADEAGAGASTRLAPARPSRRVLAAAAVILLVGAAGVARHTSGGDSGGDEVTTLAPATRRYAAPDSGPAAFVPQSLPEGWRLQDLDPAGSTVPSEPTATWQLLGDGAAPFERGILVSSQSSPPSHGRVLGDVTDTINGQPAAVGPSPDPLAADAIKATWFEGDVVHDALAVGMTRDELVAHLETLTPRADPATGFAVPADASLPEVETATVDDIYSFGVTYAGPVEGDAIGVTTFSPGHYGGLLHQLVGEPTADGHLIRDIPDIPFSLAREDGRVVEVTATERVVTEDQALPDDVLDSLVPVTAAELVEQGLAQPVTAAGAVEGLAVEVHGNDAANVAMCLTPDNGGPVCTAAVGDDSLTTGSAMVGGEWVVVAILTPATTEVAVTSRPIDHQYEDVTSEELSGEQEQAGDRLFRVFRIPDDSYAADVMIPTGDDQWSGYSYARPGA